MCKEFIATILFFLHLHRKSFSKRDASYALKHIVGFGIIGLDAGFILHESSCPCGEITLIY